MLTYYSRKPPVRIHGQASKRNNEQIYWVRHLTFFSTNAYSAIKCVISFILSPNEYGCAYDWTTLGSGPATDLQKMSTLAKKIIFSDEDNFYLSGYVNKQNCRIWGTENPHAYIEKTTHPKRVTVW